ncbi:putative quinol monooxygenase [Streptomyces sp. NPDC000880]
MGHLDALATFISAVAALEPIKVKPDRRPQFLAAVEDDATSSVRDEAGCLRFEAFQSTTDPDTYPPG